jgi:hypothetical protein
MLGAISCKTGTDDRRAESVSVRVDSAAISVDRGLPSLDDSPRAFFPTSICVTRSGRPGGDARSPEHCTGVPDDLGGGWFE